jgi:CMP/dCMP kinase
VTEVNLESRSSIPPAAVGFCVFLIDKEVAMAIVTISRQFGSGGDEIASRVSDALGYQIFDKRMIEEAAADTGLSGMDVIDYSEENFKVRTFLDRLFHSMAVSSEWMGYNSGPGVYMTQIDTNEIDEAMCLSLVKKAVYSAAQRGNIVIVGRAGQILLQDRYDALHVRIVAPMEDRIQWVKEQIKATRIEHYADIELRRKAQDMIEGKDQASSEYIRCYYHADWDDPRLYHIILNTGKVCVDRAEDIITRMVRDL